MDLNSTNTSSNFTNEDDLLGFSFYGRLMQELFTVVCLISIIAAALIVFAVTRFKKLQQVTNVIIVHLSLMQALYLLTVILWVRVHVDMRLTCVFNISVFSFLNGTVLLLILLISDWYLKQYREEKYLKFCRICNYVVAVIYALVCLSCMVGGLACIGGHTEEFVLVLLIITYVCCIIYLIIMNIVHLVKKKRFAGEVQVNHGLIIANVFLLMHCLNTCIMFAGFFLPRMDMLAFILCAALSFLNPMFNFVYLFYFHDEFNVCIKNLFKCKCKDDVQDQIVSYDGASGTYKN